MQLYLSMGTATIARLLAEDRQRQASVRTMAFDDGWSLDLPHASEVPVALLGDDYVSSAIER